MNYFLINLKSHSFRNLKGDIFIFKIEKSETEIFKKINKRSQNTETTSNISGVVGVKANKNTNNLFQFGISHKNLSINANFNQNNKIDYNKDAVEKIIENYQINGKLINDQNDDIIIERYLKKVKELENFGVKLAKLRDNKLVQYDENYDIEEDSRIGIKNIFMNNNQNTQNQDNTYDVNPHEKKQLTKGTYFLKNLAQKSSLPNFLRLFKYLAIINIIVSFCLQITQFTFKTIQINNLENDYKNFELISEGFSSYTNVIILLQSLSIHYNQLISNKEDVIRFWNENIDGIKKFKEIDNKFFQQENVKEISIVYPDNSEQNFETLEAIDLMQNRMIEIFKNLETSSSFNLENENFLFIIENNLRTIEYNLSIILNSIFSDFNNEIEKFNMFNSIIFFISLFLSLLLLGLSIISLRKLYNYLNESLIIFLRIDSDDIKNICNRCESYILDLNNPEKPNLNKLNLINSIEKNKNSNFEEDEDLGSIDEDFFDGIKKKKFNHKPSPGIKDRTYSMILIIIIQIFVGFFTAFYFIRNQNKNKINEYFFTNTQKDKFYEVEFMIGLSHQLYPNLKYNDLTLPEFSKNNVKDFFDFLLQTKNV